MSEFKTPFEKQVHDYQFQTFGGSRYVGRHLGEVQFPAEEMKKLLNFLDKPKNFLVICGNPGLGKTHFCAAISDWVLKTFDSYRYWHDEKLQERLMEGFDTNEGSPKRLSYLIDDQLVILDDVGCNGWSTWKEKVLFNFIDSRYNSMLPTIFTSNLSRSEFYKVYEPRITSRLFSKENLIIECMDGVDCREHGM